MMARAAIGTRNFRYLYSVDDERIAAVEKLLINSVTKYKTTYTIRGFENQLLGVWQTDPNTNAALWVEDEIFRGSTVLARESAARGTTHSFVDHLGSPRAITNASGTLLGTQTFDPWGSGGTTGNGALQFTGHERDATLYGTGNTAFPDYMHARYYDVSGGRFLAVDPTWQSADVSAPQSWNRYSYVRNNPINNTDPDGRICAPCAAVGGFIEGLYEGYRQVRSREPVNNARLVAAVAIGAAAGAAVGAAAPIAINSALANPATVATGTTLVGGALAPGPVAPFATGSFTTGQALQQGLVQSGGKLAGVLGAIEQGAAGAKPGSANAAMEVVQQAVTSQGLEPGLAVKATGGSAITLQNVGNVSTQIFDNGRIIVKQGEKIVLDLIQKAQ